MITTLTKTFTIAVQGKKEINEVVTLLRILQEFVFTPPSIQWDEIISLKISSLVSPDKDPHHISKIGEEFVGLSPVHTVSFRDFRSLSVSFKKITNRFHDFKKKMRSVES